MDFRIENDRVVLLSFTDGRSCRVDPNDLHRHLNEPDLARVQEALQVRRQFIKRILPPTAMTVLVICVIGLGGYDAYRMSQMVPSIQKPEQTESLKTQSVPIAPKSSNAGATVTAQSAPPVAAQSPSVSANPITSDPAPAAHSTSQSTSSLTQPASSQSPPQSIAGPLKPITKPVLKLTDRILSPLLGR